MAPLSGAQALGEPLPLLTGHAGAISIHFEQLEAEKSAETSFASLDKNGGFASRVLSSAWLDLLKYRTYNGKPESA
eukprot:scaffold731_cov261-Pinguiococcus_pyrenoidosus.AAC.3